MSKDLKINEVIELLNNPINKDDIYAHKATIQTTLFVNIGFDGAIVFEKYDLDEYEFSSKDIPDEFKHVLFEKIPKVNIEDLNYDQIEEVEECIDTDM